MMRAVLVVLACQLASACTWFGVDSHVTVTSRPQGAQVLIDGEDSGRTTPVKLDLGGLLGGDHTITLRKRGYGDESRRVLHHTSLYTSRWQDGSELRSVTFPLWWTLGDFATPFAARTEYVPSALHVVLHPAGDGPVDAAALDAAR
jgi:hypothetical protein